jgi:hypothetical protein
LSTFRLPFLPSFSTFPSVTPCTIRALPLPQSLHPGKGARECFVGFRLYFLVFLQYFISFRRR